MQEFLRLAALLVLLGVMMLVTTGILLMMGIAPSSKINIVDADTAHLAAGANALTLMISFGGAGLLYLMLLGRAEGWKKLKGLGASLSVYGWIGLFMLGLFLLLPWLALDADSFTLPASMKEVEALLEAQEDQIEALMRALIQHGALPLLLLYMAVAPAVAEELFFRGALQTQLARMMNAHLGVWLSAFIFSAIHLQVYGFIPRLLLGAVMGYLTLWTGRLAPAIWAHFLNNAYATIMAYAGVHFLEHPEWLDSTYRPPIWVALIGALIAGAAGYQLYRKLRRA